MAPRDPNLENAIDKAAEIERRRFAEFVAAIGTPDVDAARRRLQYARRDLRTLMRERQRRLLFVGYIAEAA